jgi:flagellar motor switch protein FliN
MIDNSMAGFSPGTEQMAHVVLPPKTGRPHGMKNYPLEDFGHHSAFAGQGGRNAPRTAQLDLRIELGRARIRIDESRELKSGSVLLLDTLADDLVNIHADGELIGRGEMLVIDGFIGVRMVEVFGI